MPGPCPDARPPPAGRPSGPEAFREDRAIPSDRTTIAAKEPVRVCIQPFPLAITPLLR
jgi:hypothetical protein